MSSVNKTMVDYIAVARAKEIINAILDAVGDNNDNDARRMRVLLKSTPNTTLMRLQHMVEKSSAEELAERIYSIRHATILNYHNLNEYFEEFYIYTCLSRAEEHKSWSFLRFKALQAFKLESKMK